MSIVVCPSGELQVVSTTGVVALRAAAFPNQDRLGSGLSIVTDTSQSGTALADTQVAASALVAARTTAKITLASCPGIRRDYHYGVFVSYKAYVPGAGDVAPGSEYVSPALGWRIYGEFESGDTSIYGISTTGVEKFKSLNVGDVGGAPETVSGANDPWYSIGLLGGAVTFSLDNTKMVWTSDNDYFAVKAYIVEGGPADVRIDQIYLIPMRDGLDVYRVAGQYDSGSIEVGDTASPTGGETADFSLPAHNSGAVVYENQRTMENSTEKDVGAFDAPIENSRKHLYTFARTTPFWSPAAADLGSPEETFTFMGREQINPPFSDGVGPSSRQNQYGPFGFQGGWVLDGQWNWGDDYSLSHAQGGFIGTPTFVTYIAPKTGWYGFIGNIGYSYAADVLVGPPPHPHLAGLWATFYITIGGAIWGRNKYQYDYGAGTSDAEVQGTLTPILQHRFLGDDGTNETDPGKEHLKKNPSVGGPYAFAKEGDELAIVAGVVNLDPATYKPGGATFINVQMAAINSFTVEFYGESDPGLPFIEGTIESRLDDVPLETTTIPADGNSHCVYMGSFRAKPTFNNADYVLDLDIWAASEGSVRWQAYYFVAEPPDGVPLNFKFRAFQDQETTV